MQIGLFGGTFDPPHRAHSKLVATVLKQGLFDQVWYLPVAIHQQTFAKSTMSSVADRVAMLELIQNSQTRIERFEIDSQQPSHTHTTLRALQKQYSDHTFNFVMGSDQLAKLHLWNCEVDKQCFPQAADEFKYYVYPRKNYPLTLPYANLHIITDVEPMAISSTEVREAVQNGQPIDHLVEPSVAEYIKQHKMYFKM